jgi:hypothetical protein
VFILGIYLIRFIVIFLIAKFCFRLLHDFLNTSALVHWNKSASTASPAIARGEIAENSIEAHFSNVE